MRPFIQLLILTLLSLFKLQLCYISHLKINPRLVPNEYYSSALKLTERKVEDYHLSLYFAMPLEVNSIIMHLYFESLIKNKLKKTPAAHLNFHFASVQQGYVQYPVLLERNYARYDPKREGQYIHLPANSDHNYRPKVLPRLANLYYPSDMNYIFGSLLKFLTNTQLPAIKNRSNQLGLFVLFVDRLPRDHPGDYLIMDKFTKLLEDQGYALLIMGSPEVVDFYCAYAPNLQTERTLVSSFHYDLNDFILSAARKFVQAPEIMDKGRWAPEILSHYVQEEIPRRVTKHINKRSQPSLAITFTHAFAPTKQIKDFANEFGTLKHLSGFINILRHRYGYFSLGEIDENRYNRYFDNYVRNVNNIIIRGNTFFDRLNLNKTFPVNDFAKLHESLKVAHKKQFYDNPIKGEIVHIVVILCENCANIANPQLYEMFKKYNIGVIWLESTKFSRHTTPFPFSYPSEVIYLDESSHVSDIIPRFINLIDNEFIKHDMGTPLRPQNIIPYSRTNINENIDINILIPSAAKSETLLQIYNHIRNGLNLFNQGIQSHIKADVQYAISTYPKITETLAGFDPNDICAVKMPLQKVNSSTLTLSYVKKLMAEEYAAFDGSHIFQAIQKCAPNYASKNIVGWRDLQNPKFFVVIHDDIPKHVPFYSLFTPITEVELISPLHTHAALSNSNTKVIILTYIDFINDWMTLLNSNKYSRNLYTVVPISKDTNLGLAAGAAISSILAKR